MDRNQGADRSRKGSVLIERVVDEKLEVNIGLLGPADVWKQKDEWVAREAASQEMWNTMSDDHRQAVLDIVGRALDRMHDRLEVWVPTALKVEQGRYIDVTFRILFTELEQEMRAMEEITTRKIKESAAATEEMVKALEMRRDED